MSVLYIDANLSIHARRAAYYDLCALRILERYRIPIVNGENSNKQTVSDTFYGR